MAEVLSNYLNGGKKMFELITSDRTWSRPPGVNFIELILIGGGGAGTSYERNSHVMGGGAGEVKIYKNLHLYIDSYDITVGMGGAAGTDQDGGDTRFYNFVAKGGKSGHNGGGCGSLNYDVANELASSYQLNSYETINDGDVLTMRTTGSKIIGTVKRKTQRNAWSESSLWYPDFLNYDEVQSLWNGSGHGGGGYCARGAYPAVKYMYNNLILERPGEGGQGFGGGGGACGYGEVYDNGPDYQIGGKGMFGAVIILYNK